MTQPFLHRSVCSLIRHRRRPHPQSLLRASVVVGIYPVCNHPAGVRQAFKAVPVRTLVFQGADHALHHAVMLRRVRRDELLLQTIAFHQRGVAAAGEHQAVVAAQQKALRPPAQAAKAVDQRVFQRRFRRFGLACQPSSSRVQQSITKAKWHQPSFPAQMRHKSVAQR